MSSLSDTLESVLRGVFEMSGAEAGKPYLVVINALSASGGDIKVHGVQIRDSEPRDWGGTETYVGAQILDELHAIPIPEDKFVAVRLVVGMGPEGIPVINRVSVDQIPRPEGGQPSATSPHPAVSELLALWRTVVAFRDRHEITCPETVFQTDKVAEEATSFIGDALRIVGYGDYDEDGNGGCGRYIGGIQTRVSEDQA